MFTPNKSDLCSHTELRPLANHAKVGGHTKEGAAVLGTEDVKRRPVTSPLCNVTSRIVLHDSGCSNGFKRWVGALN